MEKKKQSAEELFGKAVSDRFTSDEGANMYLFTNMVAPDGTKLTDANGRPIKKKGKKNAKRK